jgi:hypothetical protein
MKKRLLFILAICISVSSFAAPWDIKSPKVVTPAWDKPLQALKTPIKKAFESIAINFYAPEYYSANYWYSGQSAGYFMYLDLTGMHEGTWELSVNVQTLTSVGLVWATYVFLVPPCYSYYHSHVLEMTSQMSYGETIPVEAGTSLNHWWIVS